MLQDTLGSVQQWQRAGHTAARQPAALAPPAVERRRLTVYSRHCRALVLL
jgi:hypothetical protein